jgi:hypothetical protein
VNAGYSPAALKSPGQDLGDLVTATKNDPGGLVAELRLMIDPVGVGGGSACSVMTARFGRWGWLTAR